MPGYNLSAIILRRVAYADYDLILDFLTGAGDKVSAIAKNARKSRKRFAGILEPFSCLEAVFVRPRRGDSGLLLLKEAFPTNPFAGLRSDYEKTAYASYWCEIINRWVEAGGRQRGLFPLLYAALEALEKPDAVTEQVSLLFQIRFLTLAGLSPDLNACVVCRSAMDTAGGQNDKIVFDTGRGGLVCPECLTTAAGPHQICISRGTVKPLLWMQGGDLRKAGRVRMSADARRQGLAVMEQFVPYHLAAPIKSLEVLQKIRQWRQTQK